MKIFQNVSYIVLHIRLYFIISVSLMYTSCNKFTEIDAPKNSISRTKVFSSEANASEAVAGLYVQLIRTPANFNIFNGQSTLMGGLLSDELTYTSLVAGNDVDGLNQNNISTTSSLVGSQWQYGYQIIYLANIIMENIAVSNNLSEDFKRQVRGELLVIRAFSYWLLTNYFGDVPLVLTTDYMVNNTLPRSPKSAVYDQMVKDLIEAKGLLSTAYPSEGRQRPNLYAAQALLARTYLYKGSWKAAAVEAADVIAEPAYHLETDLDRVFLDNSQEAIWQLGSSNNLKYNPESGLFLVFDPSGEPGGYYLRDQSSDPWEKGDLRKEHWVLTKIIQGEHYFIPYKYKNRGLPEESNTECYMMFRLAEQYLIHAEALVHLGQLEEALLDLNHIRRRAGLNDLPLTLDETALTSYIAHERAIEYQAEWGMRWFDLNRTGKTLEVLRDIKPTISAMDLLLPVPQNEIMANHNLTQNEGY
ncbi:SusD family protein [bacterium A37T11]|nr:SusD family protein [bacterium A37T11]